MTEYDLHSAITNAARDGRIEESALCFLAEEAGVDLLAAQQAACRTGVWPARYARNAAQVSLGQQLALLQSRVLLVGLGGLGGWLLEQLLRLGVGHVTGVDGDSFEESNYNRQILGTTKTLGQRKARAAAARAVLVNPAVHFICQERFVDGPDMVRLMRGADLALDALGGLACRLSLQQAAATAGVPLVSAGIAGLTGWVAVVPPGCDGPAQWLGQGAEQGPSPEETLGNLAPTAAMAAALQAAEALKLLTRPGARQPEPAMYVFDLADGQFQHISLGGHPCA